MAQEIKFCVGCSHELQTSDLALRMYLEKLHILELDDRRVYDLIASMGIDRTKLDDPKEFERYSREVLPQLQLLPISEERFEAVSYKVGAEMLGIYCNPCGGSIAGSGIISGARYCPHDGMELQVGIVGYSPTSGGSATLYCPNRDFRVLSDRRNALGARMWDEMKDARVTI